MYGVMDISMTKDKLLISGDYVASFGELYCIGIDIQAFKHRI